MTPRQFAASLATLVLATPAAAIFDDSPEGVENAPAESGQKPVIPLDVEDPTYNLWKKRRDDLSARREPGLRHRADRQPAAAGVPDRHRPAEERPDRSALPETDDDGRK